MNILENKTLLNLKGEIWKDVVGWEGVYMVSNLGRIKSVQRVVYRRGSNKVLYTQKELIVVQHGKKYRQVNLYKGSKLYHYYVHILMAKAFIGNPLNKAEVNHKNGIHADNRIKNLEWVTRSENIQHSYDIGIRKHHTWI